MQDQPKATATSDGRTCCGKYETAAPWLDDWRYCAERRMFCRLSSEAIPAWQLTQPLPPKEPDDRA